jgi:hypothetical protein
MSWFTGCGVVSAIEDCVGFVQVPIGKLALALCCYFCDRVPHASVMIKNLRHDIGSAVHVHTLADALSRGASFLLSCAQTL